MPKTALAASDAWDMESKRCEIHDCELTYSRKHRMWYCKECLYASFLTHQAQQEAARRYRQSQKGREAARRYEQSEGGKAAREKYLKSEKYKARRKEYNQRLQESLRIAREVLGEKATVEKEEEKIRTEELAPLIQDIREYIDTMVTSPSPDEVIKWAREAYGIDLTPVRAIELIRRAEQRRG